jgi:hypothetical protein
MPVINMDIFVIIVASHSFYCSQIMARLGIEPRLPKYVSVMEQHVDLASKADQIEEKAQLLQKPPDTLVIRNRAYCSITAPCTVCR